MKELRVILYGEAILSAMFAAYLSFQTELIEDHPTMLQKNLGSDNLIDTSKDVKVPEQENVLPEPETKLGQRFLPSGFGQMYREITSPITGGAKIYDGDFENYSKYIDRPFSMGEIDLDDTRVEGMSVLERLQENAFESSDTTSFVILSFLALLAALWLDYRLLR